MGGRTNTLVCCFDPRSPRISAYDIHEWIHETMCLQEDEVAMVQIDGAKRRVYVKLHEYQRMCDILASTNGEGEFRYNNGEISTVRIEAAGPGTERVRLANIPPDVPNRIIKMVLERYGKMREVHVETWSQAYRYPVVNGIRATVVTLVSHIPSHV